MGDRPAQFLLRDDLVGHRLHDVGTGDEHEARILHHEDEVGHRRGVDRAAGTRSHDDADLGDDSAREHVALEHFGIAAEAGDALLDAGAARIVEADDRRADLHRHVHDLADLLRVALGQRAAEDGEILAEDEDQPAVDRPRSGDDAVAGDHRLLHAEVDAIMLDIHVDLFEAAGIEQHRDPLARGQPALLVLAVDPRLAAAERGLVALVLELFQDREHRLSVSFGATFPFQRCRRHANVKLRSCEAEFCKTWQ